MRSDVMGKRKLPAQKVQPERCVFEEEISEIFPLQELKALLERHGYTMDSARGFRYEGTTENQVMLQLERRIPGKDGTICMAGFKRRA
jgi:hypothetical protein